MCSESLICLQQCNTSHSSYIFSYIYKGKNWDPSRGLSIPETIQFKKKTTLKQIERNRILANYIKLLPRESWFFPHIVSSSIPTSQRPSQIFQIPSEINYSFLTFFSLLFVFMPLRIPYPFQ